MVVRMKRCPKCLRNDVPREHMFCGCGYAFDFRPAPPPQEPELLPPMAQWVDPAPHDISTATLASLFVIGSGQMYNHQFGKGMLLLGLSLVLFILTAVFRSGDLLALTILFWLANIADAAVIAGRLLAQQRVTSWQWF